MPDLFGYFYPDHSDWWRTMRAHFRAKGITNDRKINSLCFRWIDQKGYRMPGNATGEQSK